jgi:hypothetical protein
MRTTRQKNGDLALEIVRRHSGCRHCQNLRWKVIRREQDGVDLQCRSCGRLAEVKGVFCGTRVRSRPRPSIPSGSIAVRQRQRQQCYAVDLYLVSWDEAGRFVVRAVAAEEQPEDFITARPILTGPRAGYVISDIRLASVPRKAFPILAEGLHPIRRMRRRASDRRGSRHGLSAASVRLKLKRSHRHHVA